MKSITLLPPNNFQGIYHFQEPQTAFCSIAEKGKVRQLTDFMHCREIAIDHLRADICDVKEYDKHYHEIYEEDRSLEKKNIPLDKTRLLIYRKVQNSPNATVFNKRCSGFEIEIINGVEIINAFEKELGWIRTRVYRANHKEDITNRVYMVVGSKRWLSCPQALSIYILLLRSGGINDAVFHKGVDVFLSSIRNMRTINYTDKSYLKNRSHQWLLFLRNIGKIFGRRNMHDRYLPKSSEGYDLSFEGIAAMLEGETEDQEAYKRWKTVLSNAKRKTVLSNAKNIKAST